MKLKTHAKKLVIILSGLLVLGCIVVIFTVNNKSNITKSPVSSFTTAGPLSQIEYQVEAKKAVTEYELFLKGQIPITTITTRKQELLDLTISKEFQGLHLQLVTIADALLALNEGQTQEKNHAEQLLLELYSQYPWLNN